MFYDNLKKACKDNNISVTSTLKQIGIGTANGTYWKNGSVPASNIVVQLAEFLNVTTDFLLLGKSPSADITADEQELIDIYKGLSPRNQGRLIERGQMLLESQQRNNDEKCVSVSEPIQQVSDTNKMD